MTQKRSRHPLGIEISPSDTTVDTLTREGELAVDITDAELKIYLDGAKRTAVTEDQIQALSNKGIDADSNTILNLEVDNLKSGVLNTSITLATASDTQIPSALAVKTYIDDKAAAQNEASEISFLPVGSVTSTNVQDAIDEVATVTTNTTSDLSNLTTDFNNHLTDATDAHDASAISNVPSGNLAATDVQSALNELQSDIDSNSSGVSTVQGDLTAHINDTTDAHDASSISNIPSGNLAATDVQSALNELQSDIDTRVSTTTSATLSNKNLVDNSTFIIDNTDASKRLTFDIAGATGTTTTILSSQTVDRSLTLPDATDTLVGKATTDTFTNKTINGSNNTITNVSLTTGVTGSLPITNGGTNSTTKSGAFDSLSPMTTSGDMVYGGVSGTGTRLPKGTDGQVLGLSGGLPAWQAPPPATVQIATIKDVKSNGSQGGSLTAFTWNTRVLNTLDDPNSIVTSLSGNIFTLPSGTYYFRIEVPTYHTGYVKSRLYNITAGSVSIVGQGAYIYQISGISIISGIVTINTSSQFRVEFNISISNSSSDGGLVNTGFGEVEVYTQVSIERIL